ncbi:C-GCAxxG-C-C family protein [Paludicola sp. MB14-C6]|uniref:C-GCAxxG-C-C family protein n=1 Tax=Paludihabitans sp. MB14-C6 TaxID=3070656 RepID=UPI0027DC030D|nr:C-GCAxxG-C-C family protein [Paludicola sp. MB14-C6]WMJ23780.1 C-GCAxxG-C-C family protein [Paludicola sp. MB14-C6]
MDHATLAKSYFNQGFNCAQSVLCAFCDETGLDINTAKRLSSSFGGGMGRLREVCGAVSGMFMIAGILYGYDDVTDKQQKDEHYTRIQNLAEQFKKECGTIICRELLELPEGADSPISEARTQAYYQKRPCAEYVAAAANIMEQYMKNNLIK